MDFIFSSQPPFYSRDTAEMYDNILHKPLRLRTNISASARNVLEKVSCFCSERNSSWMFKVIVDNFLLALICCALVKVWETEPHSQPIRCKT